jgi:metal-dependent hydrolase (beta-lactamase superfamily II)
MLKVLYANHKAPDEDLSFQDVLLAMRSYLKKGGYSQIPQLTSSRPLDVKSKFEIVPDGSTGTHRAVIIGINYVGQEGQLSGCHNDAMNMMEYIKDVHGFQEENITVLLDDGEHTSPTKENILDAYRTLVASCKAGDVAFCHYSGM